ncbi:MAG: isoprenylcysteine carboxylmethyltransferase family protein [Burkholderiaceae bacterium]
MKFLELKLPPPIVGLTTALLMWAIAKFLPGLTVVFPWQFELAVLLAVVGVLCDLAGLYSFRKGNTTINPLKPTNTARVITSGIYRVSRNPMYLGMSLILTGWAVYLGHPLALLMLTVFVIYINRFQITPEERILSAKFGDEFTTYMASVRRWL